MWVGSVLEGTHAGLAAQLQQPHRLADTRYVYSCVDWMFTVDHPQQIAVSTSTDNI